MFKVNVFLITCMFVQHGTLIKPTWKLKDCFSSKSVRQCDFFFFSFTYYMLVLAN